MGGRKRTHFLWFWVERNNQIKWFLTWEYDSLALVWVKILKFQVLWNLITPFLLSLSLYIFFLLFLFFSLMNYFLQGNIIPWSFPTYCSRQWYQATIGQQVLTNWSYPRGIAYDWLVLWWWFLHVYLNGAYLFINSLWCCVLLLKVKLH